MWSLAAELVEKVEDGMGGDWNEGLMEVRLNSLLAGGSRTLIRNCSFLISLVPRFASPQKPTAARAPCPALVSRSRRSVPFTLAC